MPVFYLIRHGQKNSDLLNPSLTELGHQQAKATGKHLSAFPISKIIASPMLRTQQTAKYIAEALNLKIETDIRLRERMDFDQAPGVGFEEFILEWMKASYDRNYLPKWGDSSAATAQRLIEVIDEHTLQKNSHIALVTHGGAIADFLRSVFSDELLVERMHDYELGPDYLFDECSVTTVEKNGEGFKMLDLHCISHL